MTGAADLVRRLTERGVSLETDGIKIRWRDPTGVAVSPDALGELATHKSEVIGILTGGKVAPLPPRADHDDMRYGQAFGNPKTWSGRVVSLAEWRGLSEWDRHGPDGKVWSGKTRQWEEPA